MKMNLLVLLWIKVKKSWKSSRKLDEAKARLLKLDKIIQNLYEDNLNGKISDERFMKLSSSYEEESSNLKSKISELENFISKSKEESLNAKSFLKMVNKYTDIKELDSEIIRTFVDKIYVEKPK